MAGTILIKIAMRQPWLDHRYVADTARMFRRDGHHVRRIRVQICAGQRLRIDASRPWPGVR